jgi:acetylornithine deacetylase
MQLAIAEKGLLVLDVIVKGTASHAAHQNLDNSIYKAIPVIEWFNSYNFEKISEVLGPVKMTVTQINAGKQHNVVPAECHLVVDIRVNDCYSNQEILDTVRANVTAEINPRSMHLNFFHSCFSWIGAGRNRIRKNHLRLAYPFRSIGFELQIIETRAW